MKMRQRGVALFVAMLMVLLASLLVTTAARTAWFGELVLGSEADYQRAFANAQALLQDAEFDIQGRRPDGSPCRTQAQSDGSCRVRSAAALAQGRPWFPQDGREEFTRLQDFLAARTPSCVQGICIGRQLTPEFWNLPSDSPALDNMKRGAAHYGEFTGAPSALASNPLLMTQAWYWVEVLPFDAEQVSPTTDAMAPDVDNPFVFRITVLADGRKPSTRAVLQSLFVWKRIDS